VLCHYLVKSKARGHDVSCPYGERQNAEWHSRMKDRLLRMNWRKTQVKRDDYAEVGDQCYGRPEDEWFVANIGPLWNFCLICLERCITQLRRASKLYGRIYLSASRVFSEFRVEIFQSLRVEILWEALWQLQKWQ
jgi:hypothetical protein